MRGPVFLRPCIQADLWIAENVKMCHNFFEKIGSDEPMEVSP